MDPDQASVEDMLRSITEAGDITEAVRLTIGVLADRDPLPITSDQLAETLIDRLYDEHDLAAARHRDHELARQDRLDRFEERRIALDLAVLHNRNLIADTADSTLKLGIVSVTDLAREFHDMLTGVEVRSESDGRLEALRARREPVSDPALRGVDELFRDTTAALERDPSTQTHRHGAETVYREGNRLRQRNGTGYADSVSDSQILQHLRQPGTPLDHAFQIAVLAIRNYERLAPRL